MLAQLGAGMITGHTTCTTILKEPPMPHNNAWFRLPASFRSGLIIICAACGSMGVLVWREAAYLAVVGLILAIVELIRPEEPEDHHSRQLQR